MEAAIAAFAVALMAYLAGWRIRRHYPDSETQTFGSCVVAVGLYAVVMLVMAAALGALWMTQS